MNPSANEIIKEEVAKQEVLRAKITHYKQVMFASLYNAKPECAAVNLVSTFKGITLTEVEIPPSIAVKITEAMLELHRYKMQQSVAIVNELRGRLA